MKKVIALLILLCISSLSAKDWVPPSVDLHPDIVIHPNAISASRWLWFEAQETAPETDCYYRGHFSIGERVKSVELTCYFDDLGELYLNGKRMDKNKAFEQKNLKMKAANYVIPLENLQKNNLLSVHVRNGKYTGGFFMLGKKYLDDGSIEYFHSTTQTWKAAPAEQIKKNWEKIDYDDSAWAAAKDFGDVLATPWIVVTDIMNLCTTPAEKKQYDLEKQAAIALPATLVDETDYEMKTVWKNGCPFWKIGKEEFPPIILRTSNPLTSIHKSDHLLKCIYSGTRVVEYGIDTKRVEIGDGIYDFSMITDDVGRLLNLAPKAFLVLGVRMSHLDNWLKNHPEEKIGYAMGPADNRVSELWHSLDVGGRPILPSYASEPFRREMENFVRSFSEHVKTMPWYKRVVAVRVSYGCYSEWHYYGMAGQMPDTGKAMTTAFRQYLHLKYANNSALQTAWHDEKVTRDTAKVPNAEERHGRGFFLRDSGTCERKVLDYYECMQEVVGDTLLVMAAAVKKHLPKVQVGAYYGYVFGMAGFPSEGQTLALEKVLSSPHIDFLSSPYSYSRDARNMGGNGMIRTIPEIFLRHKKVALNELDTRTHLTPKKQYCNTTTAEESAQIFLRDMALSAMSGIGIHLVDMGNASQPGWWNAPEIYKAIHDAIENWDDFRNNVRKMDNDIAVIFDYRELFRNGHPVANKQRFNTMLGDTSLSALYLSGYNFDLLSINGLLKSKKKYKVLIFLNAISLDESERQAIIAKTRQKGSSTVWIYAPGLVSENGFSKATMKQLTGIALDYDSEKLPVKMILNNGRTLGHATLAEAPRVFVVDNECEVLAKYENASVAMAEKILKGNVRALFSGVPILDSGLWSSILSGFGVKPYSEPGIFIKAQKPYLLVHVAKAGSYNIVLPHKSKEIKSVFDNALLASNTDNFVLECDGCKTWLIKY